MKFFDKFKTKKGGSCKKRKPYNEMTEEEKKEYLKNGADKFVDEYSDVINELAKK